MLHGNYRELKNGPFFICFFFVFFLTFESQMIVYSLKKFLKKDDQHVNRLSCVQHLQRALVLYFEENICDRSLLCVFIIFSA